MRLTLSYDAIAEIARLPEEKRQAELIDALLSGASQQEIRERIREIKSQPKKVKGEQENPKPKQAYATSQKTVVIVQSRTHRLTHQTIIDSLQEALRIARKKE